MQSIVRIYNIDMIRVETKKLVVFNKSVFSAMKLLAQKIGIINGYR